MNLVLQYFIIWLLADITFKFFKLISVRNEIINGRIELRGLQKRYDNYDMKMNNVKKCDYSAVIWGLLNKTIKDYNTSCFERQRAINISRI